MKLGLGQGLPPASVFDIQINPATNKTVIFTYGRGAFELVRELAASGHQTLRPAQLR